MSKTNTSIKAERCYHGVAVAPGIVEGTVFLHLPATEKVPFRKIKEEEFSAEIKRFEEAILATQQELLEVQRRIASLIGESNANLFDAHLLVLEDPMLFQEVLESLERDRCNIEYIFDTVVKRSCKRLSKAEHAYLSERTLDIEDVSQRILHHLLGKPRKRLLEDSHNHILIANTLTASDAVMLYRDHVVGFATEAGSKTSHTAIIARALGIPVIVGLHQIVSELEDGDDVLLDGYGGMLIINPTVDTVRRYHEIKLRQHHLETDLKKIRTTLPVTRDGRHITLSANIELPKEIESVIASGAEGVGLYRTEFLYLNRSTPPNEEEQYKVFRQIAEKSKPHNVTIRTFDIGADKPVKFIAIPAEANPTLGCRGIRFALQHRALFKTQLRALLRAAVVGNLKIMYPMIARIEGLREANSVLEEAKQELRDEGTPFFEGLEVGIMIEVPSAVMVVDLLAQEVKFFSIGTNDLIQYMIAVDRGNEIVAHLYNPADTAIVRTLKKIIDTAHQAGIWVGVCGELAGDILFTPLLVGLGIDELSASPILVPRVKKAVQNLDVSTCQKLVLKMLHGENAQENYQCCRALAENCYGMLITDDIPFAFDF
ncbi:MAG: phosphoenolpyruvate--protein phosphotransferase [Chthoniobacterales bacterium]